MTDLPPGAVTVADLYRELVGMRADVVKALTRIEVIDTVNRSAEDIHRDHESRLRGLEQFKWKVFGASITVSVITGGGAAWIALTIAHH